MLELTDEQWEKIPYLVKPRKKGTIDKEKLKAIFDVLLGKGNWTIEYEEVTEKRR